MAYAFGPFVLDAAAGRLRRDGVDVPAQPRVLDLLAALAEADGALVSREALTRRVWSDVHVSANVLDQALRRARQALGDDPGAPKYVEAVARRGWRLIPTVHRVHLAAGLIGRDGELAALVRTLEAPGRVVVWGPAGAGKSRLAREAVAQLGAWPGGVVELPSGVRVDSLGVDPLDLAVQAALGLAVEGGSAGERVAAALGGLGRALIVVESDGQDRDVIEVIRVVDRWLAEAPELSVLIVSRARPPLDVHAIEVGPLRPDDARALLRARIHAAQPDADPDDRALDAVLALLGGLPLAIELAASRLRVIGLAELTARLREGRATSVLGASLAQAWGALGPDAQRVLAASAAVGRPFAAAEVEALVPDADALDALAHLRDAGLLAGEAGALAVVGAMRAFAKDQAEADGRWQALRAAWRRRALGAASRWVAGALRVEVAALEALYRQRVDLVDVFTDAPPSERAELAVAIGLALRYVGPWDLALRTLEDAAGSGANGAVGVLLGEYRLRAGDVAGAADVLRRCLGEPEPLLRALAGVYLARAEIAAGRTDAAEVLASAAVDDADLAGAAAAAAMALDAAGSARAARGDLLGATALYEQAAARASVPGLDSVRGAVLTNHAAWLGRAGDHEAAHLGFAAAAADFDALPFPHLAATARSNLGLTLLELGRDREAVDALQRAAAACRAAADRGSERVVLGRLATAALLAGDSAAAAACAQRLGAIATDPRSQTDLALLGALIAWSDGAIAVAEAKLALAQVLARVCDRTDEVRLFAAAFAAGSGRGTVDLDPGSTDPLAAVIRGGPPRGAMARLLARLIGRRPGV